ncbi:hypothetical protein EGT74_10435 [Chitinophaga lutea]|uniref:Uncharacterized protein n=1 Tax=Chitinophaga lutea TaxID=2488634 RepID=A0A3N4Q8L7_9BACT|nr:hypothetical protein [Chitinophaga lutea]RPE13901.1 hypothetical protein EGT74_10435 [Chitinophaga lutea]
MKSKSLIPGLALLAVALFSACDKKDIFDDNHVKGHFSLKVNDSLVTVTKQLTASLYDSTGNYVLVISGLTASNQGLTVNVVFPGKQLKAGEYKLSATDMNYIAWMKKLGTSDNYSADDVNLNAAATITIESITESKAKGTFSGILVHDVVAEDKKTVTGGTFEVSPIIRMN